MELEGQASLLVSLRTAGIDSFTFLKYHLLLPLSQNTAGSPWSDNIADEIKFKLLRMFLKLIWSLLTFFG